eukprot:608051-Pleurochrysis_carterae.AAC.1
MIRFCASAFPSLRMHRACVLGSSRVASFAPPRRQRAPQQQASSAPTAAQALAAMHEAFGQLVACARQRAAAANAARDLQLRLDELAQRNVDSAIERISADLAQLRSVDTQGAAAMT